MMSGLNLMIFGIIALLVAIIILSKSYSKKYEKYNMGVTSSENYLSEKDIKDLNDKGFIILLMNRCGWCAKQKTLLGDNLQKLKYYTVDDPSSGYDKLPLRLRNRIRGYPCWVNQNTEEIHPGFKEIPAIKSLIA